MTRTDTSPAKHSESTFDFLNRADGPIWARVRMLIDEWWNEHPDAARAGVRGRIRSGDDHAFRAAFFEMYGYQVLRRVRDAVIEHPVTETHRQPDFLATSDGADSLVMEMTSTGASDADKARAGRLKTIYDQINSWEIPNFMLHVVVHTEGPGNPSLRRLHRGLRDWIDGLDVDEIAAMTAASDNYLTEQSAPRYTWTEAGWSIEFGVILLSSGARAASTNAIGIYGPNGAAWVNDVEPIRRRLADKAGAYGDFHGPFRRRSPAQRDGHRRHFSGRGTVRGRGVLVCDERSRRGSARAATQRRLVRP